MALFGTSGIRGVVNKDFYPDFYLDFGLISGSVIKEKRLALAADGRLTMSIVKNAVISGLTATGHDIIDVGILPTPALQYYCKAKQMPGIMVTASHNPAEYNGLKLVLKDGTDRYGRERDEIERIFSEMATAKNRAETRAKIKYVGFREAGKINADATGRALYVDGIAKLADVASIRKAELKVLFDCVNGATTQTTPFIFDKLGIEAVPLNENLDGSFPAHSPEPIEVHLRDTINRVREGGVDFGVVFDSDGDRAVFISPEGRYIEGNFYIPMITRLKLEKGDSLVMPVNTADTVSIVAAELGVKMYKTKIGRQHVVTEMTKHGSKIGGEENGSFIYAPHQYCGDGGIALALFSEAVAKNGLGQLLDSLPKLDYLRDKVTSPKEFSEVREIMLKHKHVEADETDGLKIRFDEKRWIMVRRSGTEPVYRIYAQAEKREEAMKMIASYKKELFAQ